MLKIIEGIIKFIIRYFWDLVKVAGVLYIGFFIENAMSCDGSDRYSSPHYSFDDKKINQSNNKPDVDGCSTSCNPDYPNCKDYCPFFWD